MNSGFGPQKAKHFASAISNVVVTADEVSSPLALAQGVRENQRISCRGTGLGEPALVTRRGPGQFFGTGTFPGGSGIETGHLLSVGDVIEIGIEGVGALTNTIVAEEDVGIEGHRPIKGD
jgi:hypothetical protein